MILNDNHCENKAYYKYIFLNFIFLKQVRNTENFVKKFTNYDMCKINF